MHLRTSCAAVLPFVIVATVRGTVISAVLSAQPGSERHASISQLVLEFSTKLFNAMDGNEDGVATWPDMRNVFRSFDQNGNDEVDADEFDEVYAGVFTGRRGLGGAFVVLADLNGSGVVELGEVRRMFDRIDSNGDEQISRREFDIKFFAVARRAEELRLSPAIDNTK